MVGCWQALVTSRLSGCSLVWKSLDVGAKDAEDAQTGRKGGKRLLVYRERRKTPS